MNDEPSQLDIFEALIRRDAALEKIAANTSPWLHFALEKLKTFPSGMEGTAEDFRIALWTEGMEEPLHHNAWGMFTMNAVKRKLLVPTGEYRPMRGAKSHGRKTAVYRLQHG